MTLYLLTNRLTGMAYVGATTIALGRRMDSHRRDALVKRRTTVLCAAIREYGWDAFEVSVLRRTDDVVELHRWEREMIVSLQTLQPNGYNMAVGGLGVEGTHHSAETRQRISAGRLGVTAWNKGQKLPWLSALRMGAGNPMAKAIVYQGCSYGSIADASRAVGLSVTQLKYRLKNGEATYLVGALPS